ncbi:hypothetical protein EDB80DRAFT_842694 [Ilyonectria destructans]|nr:hypothetical protein EDB80DRAFT_842694 [Ilyonectria destructans]
MPSTTQFKPLGGKVSLVTGSSRGIGAAIALHLASLGSHAVINYVSSSSAAKDVAAKIRKLGVNAITVQADVTMADDIVNLFETVKSEFGRLNIAMSNSGVEHFGHLSEVSGDDIDRVLSVNAKAQYLLRSSRKGPSHLSWESTDLFQGIPNHALYAASKAAIMGMHNITVNCIALGGIKTDMYAEAAAKYITGGDKLSEAEINERVGRMSHLESQVSQAILLVL